MSDTLLSPLPSLRLSDDDIPPATATLCRWHPQPRPTAAKTQILQHAGTGPTARTPTKITDPATHSISLPRYGGRVGLHIDLFEACSAFTRVAACTLAQSPNRDR